MNIKESGCINGISKDAFGCIFAILLVTFMSEWNIHEWNKTPQQMAYYQMNVWSLGGSMDVGFINILSLFSKISSYLQTDGSINIIEC